MFMEEHTRMSTKRQIYLLIHARILKVQTRYKCCTESPMGHHLNYLYTQKVP